jgi:hypothetical protein
MNPVPPYFCVSKSENRIRQAIVQSSLEVLGSKPQHSKKVEYYLFSYGKQSLEVSCFYSRPYFFSAWQS